MVQVIVGGCVGGLIGGSIVIFIAYSVDFITGDHWWKDDYGKVKKKEKKRKKRKEINKIILKIKKSLGMIACYHKIVSRDEEIIIDNPMVFIPNYNGAVGVFLKRIFYCKKCNFIKKEEEVFFYDMREEFEEK